MPPEFCALQTGRQKNNKKKVRAYLRLAFRDEALRYPLPVLFVNKPTLLILLLSDKY
jgi:hypothetical protein